MKKGLSKKGLSKGTYKLIDFDKKYMTRFFRVLKND
jgi:hypothetical protein